MVRQKRRLHGSNRKVESPIFIKEVETLVSTSLTYLHKTRAMRIIRTPVIFLPDVLTITIDSQDHHPTADGAHRNGIRSIGCTKLSSVLHFQKSLFEQIHKFRNFITLT